MAKVEREKDNLGEMIVRATPCKVILPEPIPQLYIEHTIDICLQYTLRIDNNISTQNHSIKYGLIWNDVEYMLNQSKFSLQSIADKTPNHHKDIIYTKNKTQEFYMKIIVVPESTTWNYRDFDNYVADKDFKDDIYSTFNNIDYNGVSLNIFNISCSVERGSFDYLLPMTFIICGIMGLITILCAICREINDRCRRKRSSTY